MKQEPKFAVLPWRGDGRYDSRDIVKKFVSQKVAQKFADANIDKNFVVRDLKYIWERTTQNPLASGYSRQTVSRNIAELRRSGRAGNVAAAIALRKARASWRARYPVGRFPRHLRRKLTQRNPLVMEGERLYQGFMQRQPTTRASVRVPAAPKVGLAIGKVCTIIYESDRGGSKHLYRHDFGQQSRPLFVASSDGKRLLLLGGAYRFTNRGIVDRRQR